MACCTMVLQMYYHVSALESSSSPRVCDTPTPVCASREVETLVEMEAAMAFRGSCIQLKQRTGRLRKVTGDRDAHIQKVLGQRHPRKAFYSDSAGSCFVSRSRPSSVTASKYRQEPMSFDTTLQRHIRKGGSNRRTVADRRSRSQDLYQKAFSFQRILRRAANLTPSCRKRFLQRFSNTCRLADIVQGPACVSQRWQRCSLQPCVWLTRLNLPQPVTDLPCCGGWGLPRLYSALQAGNLLSGLRSESFGRRTCDR